MGEEPTEQIQQAVEDVAEARSFAVPLQIVRGLSAVIWCLLCSISVHVTQLIGWPLKFINAGFYHAYIDITKQSFCIFLTSLIQYWTPVEVTIDGDASMQGKFAKDADDNLISKFGDKAVLISNHQLYIDWAYMWWVAFSSRAHGGLFIILKASLKWVPIWGWGMQFFRFIFLSRKWANDEKVLQQGLQTITNDKDWPTWMLLFPEGTTMSRNGVDKTVAFAKKKDLAVPKHVLLPRSTGLRYSLVELSKTIDYLYDATIYYHGVPVGEFGEEYFTLRNMYLRGQYPKHVNMYWRRWAISEIPFRDEVEFEQWVRDRWCEKDQLMENFITTGKWVEEEKGMEQISVKVKLRSWIEMLQIFSVPLNVILVGSLLYNHLLPLLRG